MPEINGFLSLLDSRSFTTVWFWVLLILSWSVTGRGVLGVPGDVIARARREPEGEPGLLLLDWLSLSLPRWRLGPREGAVLLGVGLFVITSLGVLGFLYGLEMAQALVLLMAPFGIILLLRLRLARQLSPMIDAARAGETPPDQVTLTALRKMVVHRRMFTMASILTITVTAFWAARWAVLHPHGL